MEVVCFKKKKEFLVRNLFDELTLSRLLLCNVSRCQSAFLYFFYRYSRWLEFN